MKTDHTKSIEAFGRLLDIMDELREKCPWDKKQTFETIRNLTIEETYELADAILDKDMENIKKELGDLMLHLVFYSKIASEQNVFNATDVINNICDKLVYRHPHVFSNVKVENSREVEENWEQLKIKEKNGNKTVLSGVPKSLPSLVKAHRIQEKVSAVGFDWEKPSQIWDKFEEELNELKNEIKLGSFEKIENEFGDLFFSLVNAARLYKVEPETALERTNKKFMKRFNYLESKTIAEGQSLKNMSLDEMNVYWEQAKEYDNQ
ncbi:MAG TPA: nucleoside triphosphate pyrophosphohydrolase [Tenuifilaceae bacterium]|nr:nucleoside triphosphate pyrophosphohydrolase [Tenuifilaceae bacterium]HPE17988.1 nucleoside triphosphate pyrophosphohydrolase [Tenuifilaceae bacterium]HPJ44892.1 nucleoside triphosphate pyrophosphohydrolase [Tenuifilaceae bacterium]HPQ33142.1 nucleoside triphosphate pyrophosphohydrolase [Tenuifilaceae bacterium]HRX67075.1 nucleoside triphosphate pyrophosphohydrolase [Tenuifilaceae bacterium]